MSKTTTPTAPVTETRPAFMGIPYAKASEAKAARDELLELVEDSDSVPPVGEVDVALLYDVVSDTAGLEGRYPAKAEAAAHVKALEAQAAGGDWRGPVPEWRVELVELVVDGQEG